MSKANVIAVGTYPAWDQDAMREGYELTEVATPDDILDLTQEIRTGLRALALIGHKPLTGAHMDALPNLEIIANYGVGYDAIDDAAASARGIKVTNTPDVLNDDVADTALAMMLALTRQIPQGHAHIQTGAWQSGQRFPLNRQFSGGVAGIMGLGRIGREIADRLVAFKMDIHYHSRAPKPDAPSNWVYHATPESLAAAVDWLVVALVGGAQTENYVSRAVIQAMPEESILVNISRGSTVDEDALLTALETGAIRGAALDVFRNEPNVDPRFLKLDNVILQPHQGSGSVETRKIMSALQRANIDAQLAGEPLVTPVN
ncbi:2-hydroxyacid dehydrogenase [Albirhodobacter sp. R86504]|uniref:2-hydroxyacid dehydrogenase n=1 Tax=Albirhodobacter sp. R86504 TaxID=3093848 RepID=UPI00366F5775